MDEDQSPLGTGTVLLLGLGAAYLATKKRKNQKNPKHHNSKFFLIAAALTAGMISAQPNVAVGQTRTENTVRWTATSGGLGSGIGSGTINTTNSDGASYSWDYTRTLISGSSYTGWTSSCIQLGKNGGVENLTLTTSNIPGVIKSVSVECSSYNASHRVSITVGTSTYLSSTATPKWTTVEAKTGTGNSSGEITISFTGGSRALYIKSISVTYETGSSTNPVVTITQPTGGTIAVSNNNTNVPSGTDVAAGTTLTLSNTPGDAYTFGSYSVYKTGDQSTTVTVTNGTFTMPEYNVTVTGTFNAKPTHTITLTQPTGGVGTIASNPSGSAYEGQTVTLTANEVSREFTSWNVTGATVANQNSPTTTFTMGSQDVTVSATFTENPNADFLTAQLVNTAMSSNSGYNNWSNVTSNSGVKYSGQSNYTTSYIQIRNSTPSGIVSTTSGGYVRKVALTWKGNNGSGRKLIVFGNNSAYTGPSQLYNTETSGDTLGIITYGTSTELVISENYEFVGIKADGAAYFEPLKIVWEPVACPSPTNVTANNATPNSLKLNWTAVAAQTAWVVAYSKTTGFDPEDLTACTHVDADENPFIVTGLDPETQYYFRVKGDCGTDGESAWSAQVTGTTLGTCPIPTNLTANNLTQNTSDINWVGYNDSYNLRYRYHYQFNYDFESAEPWVVDVFSPCTTYDGDGEATGSIQNVTFTNEGYTGAFIAFQNGSGATNATAHSGEAFGACFFANADPVVANNDFFILPEITIGQGYVFKFWARSFQSSYLESFKVGVYGSQGTFTSYLAGSATESITAPVEWTEYSYDLSSYAGQTIKLAINCVSEDRFAFFIDDISVDGYYNWSTIADITSPYTIQGLTAGRLYDVQVQAGCDTGDNWSDVMSFTTLTEGNKVFTTAGNWNTDNSWIPSGAPAATDNAIIRANVTIPNGTVATANNISFEGTTTPTLIIDDGGELVVNNSVEAVVYKTINNWNTTSWYFIASPLATSTNPTSVSDMITDTYTGEDDSQRTYDLYSLDVTQSTNCWQNYRKHQSNFSLINGMGYLYASKAGTDLVFSGNIQPSNENVTLNNLNDGFNLVGNPYTCTAYVNKPHYTLSQASDGITSSTVATSKTTAIAPLTGVIINDNSATFSKNVPDGSANNGNIQIVLAQTVNTRGNAGSATIDNAIVSFNEGSQLEKFYFGEQNANIYIPQGNEEYAIVSAEAQGEMPVCFKAKADGQYTISVDAENVEMGYLHLIDNITGADVDLLANPSYTFNAKWDDYASRFRLVFSANNSNNAEAESDNFAFISNGQIILNGVNNNATLQVIDMMGRIVSSEQINGNSANLAPTASGVYVLRLINGTETKTQKIVVK